MTFNYKKQNKAKRKKDKTSGGKMARVRERDGEKGAKEKAVKAISQSSGDAGLSWKWKLLSQGVSESKEMEPRQITHKAEEEERIRERVYWKQRGL